MWGQDIKPSTRGVLPNNNCYNGTSLLQIAIIALTLVSGPRSVEFGFKTVWGRNIKPSTRGGASQ